MLYKTQQKSEIFSIMYIYIPETGKTAWHALSFHVWFMLFMNYETYVIVAFELIGWCIVYCNLNSNVHLIIHGYFILEGILPFTFFFNRQTKNLINYICTTQLKSSPKSGCTSHFFILARLRIRNRFIHSENFNFLFLNIRL